MGMGLMIWLSYGRAHSDQEKVVFCIRLASEPEKRDLIETGGGGEEGQRRGGGYEGIDDGVLMARSRETHVTPFRLVTHLAPSGRAASRVGAS